MARPIFSADDHGASKFKMEKFLQPGQNAMATVYAPISYGPLPLLAFHRDAESGEYRVAAVGQSPSSSIQSPCVYLHLGLPF